MDLGRGFEPRPHQKLEGAWSNKWQKKEKDKWGITNPRKVASKSLNKILNKRRFAICTSGIEL